MSKTDKHRPFEVQVSDSPREYHDHRKGFCDLPSLEEWSKENPWHKRSYGSCGWEPTNWHTYKGFQRHKGEGEWIRDTKARKYRKDWLRDEMSDLDDTLDDDDDIYGCANGCCPDID